MEKIVITESSFISKDTAEFLNQTAFVLPNWKWMALGILLAFGILLLRPGLRFLLGKIKRHNFIARSYPDTFSAHLVNFPIEKPLAWILTLLFWTATLDAVNLDGKLGSYLDHTFRAFITINIIVLLYFAVDAMKEVFLKVSTKKGSAYNYSEQLIPYAAKAIKTFIVIFGLLIALQSFGLNVMSLLAGLGLGGLALALAAQDTAANVFGSITIMFDNPFKVGDWIKVKDLEGTVTEIGFRSTRVRTFYNSVITIPNALIAKESIDNMGLRPARRTTLALGLTYETPPEKIVKFCDDVKTMIQTHDKVIQDTVIVNFNKYSSSSLDVTTIFHLKVFTAMDEMKIQQAIFIDILKIAAAQGVDFAYPTTTIHQAKLPSVL